MHEPRRFLTALATIGVALTIVFSPTGATASDRPDPVLPKVTVPTVAAAEVPPGVNNPWPMELVGAAATPDGLGVLHVYANGVVFTYGTANYGDARGELLQGPIRGMAMTPTGQGYWLVAYDGGIFSYGDAKFFGSMGGKPLNQPIFSMAATPTGLGYWLVAFDGGIFSFGDATFLGSMGGVALQQPVKGITRSTTGVGYRMVASDGGIFSFGDATFYGSLGGSDEADIIAMAPTPSGQGYWLLSGNGRIYEFGDALSMPSLALERVGQRAVAMASNPVEQGLYVFVDAASPTWIGFRSPPGAPVARWNESKAACAGGNMEACDQLWLASPFESEFERFSATCGDRLVLGPRDGGKCEALLGPTV